MTALSKIKTQKKAAWAAFICCYGKIVMLLRIWQLCLAKMEKNSGGQPQLFEKILSRINKIDIGEFICFMMGRLLGHEGTCISGFPAL